MSTLTVRNLDPEIVEALKAQGAAHGRSMEAEVRAILVSAVGRAHEPGLGERIHARFAGLGWEGIERTPEFPKPIEFE